MLRDIINFLWGTDPIAAFQHFFGPGWGWLFATVTLFGSHEAVAVVVALALWLRDRRLAYAVVGIVALAMATDLLLWQVVGLPRPSGPEVVVRGTTPVSSFPSGHTVVATCVWGLLSRFDRFPKVAALAIVLAVMLSRLYLGMHYVGDLLGGVLIGLALILVYARLWPAIAGWFSRRSFGFFLALGLAAPLAVLPFTLFITSPRVWVAFGAALGAGVGLPLEYRFVRYAPAPAEPGRVVQKLVLGLGVLSALIFAQRAVVPDTPLLDAAVFALAALWLVLGAPALFARLGLQRHAPITG